MNTEKSLYLALNNLYLAIAYDDIQWPTHSPMAPAYQGAAQALERFEIELGPLPAWASAHNITGEPVLYAQLYTRNGRAHGNGLIYHVGASGDNFGIITDMGNTMILNRKELDQCFEIGDFIMNDAAYEKRKRQRDDYIEPLEHD